MKNKKSRPAGPAALRPLPNPNFPPAPAPGLGPGLVCPLPPPASVPPAAPCPPPRRGAAHPARGAAPPRPPPAQQRPARGGGRAAEPLTPGTPGTPRPSSLCGRGRQEAAAEGAAPPGSPASGGDPLPSPALLLAPRRTGSAPDGAEGPRSPPTARGGDRGTGLKGVAPTRSPPPPLHAPPAQYRPAWLMRVLGAPNHGGGFCKMTGDEEP